VVELQADDFAGIGPSHENKAPERIWGPARIEPGDVEAAMRTAAAIGDDTLHNARATGTMDAGTPHRYEAAPGEQRSAGSRTAAGRHRRAPGTPSGGREFVIRIAWLACALATPLDRADKACAVAQTPAESVRALCRNTDPVVRARPA